MPATRRRGDPCHPGCADRRAHGDFEGKLCLAIEKAAAATYTHLSIALCRALTIPARHVGGSAVRLDRWMFMWVPKLTSAGNDICWIRPTVSHPTGSR